MSNYRSRELESTDTTYDTSIATLLEKLDLLQYSPSPLSNVTLGMDGGTGQW